MHFSLNFIYNIRSEKKKYSPIDKIQYIFLAFTFFQNIRHRMCLTILTTATNLRLVFEKTSIIPKKRKKKKMCVFYYQGLW